MTYYCSECSTWKRSDNIKMTYHNGRYVEHRWCENDRKYRAYDQDTYGCREFVYVRRAVLTKICEVLDVKQNALFNTFDEVKENYLKPCEPELLKQYNVVAKYIAEGFDKLPNKEEVAKAMFDSYIINAEANAKMGNYCEAVRIYGEMVRTLHIIFDVMNERTLFHKIKAKSA